MATQASELYSKANEYFVDEDYEKALKLYEEAISADPQNSEYYLKRAQVYIKLENYAAAESDASKAIELDQGNSRAYLKNGMAKFHMGKYQLAKQAFQDGQKIEPDERSYKTWIRKCDAEINLKCSPEYGVGQLSIGTSLGASGDGTEANPSPATDPIPLKTPEKSKYDWYQTKTHVVIAILIKKTKKEDVNVEYQENTVSATVKLPNGNDYSLELDLSHPIFPDQCVTKVLTSKIELKMKKAEGLRWNVLEGEDQQAKLRKPDVQKTEAATADANAVAHPYPSSSHYTRNWDKLAKDVEQEEKDEKKEGDAALNQLFQQIYGDGSDEVKKAMNKSFVESGGTVLSTNWKDIGDKKTEKKPPDGMEWKDYEI